jgi:50S ribosomal subunit-associated GTPase HflX
MKTGRGFLLVFSITSLSSLNELQELREQILRVKGTSSVPIVLVGNKSDLEEDRAVSRSRAFQVSQQWGRIPYYETSARRRANVDEVFKDVCRQIIRNDMEASSGGGPSRNRVSYGEVMEHNYQQEGSKVSRSRSSKATFSSKATSSPSNTGTSSFRSEASRQRRRKSRSQRSSCTIL